jgi:hypothetical protein
MRKFIFSSAMIGVIAGGWNILQATRQGPKDWRLVLLWLGWVIGAVVAVGTVLTDARDKSSAAEARSGSTKRVSR